MNGPRNPSNPIQQPPGSQPSGGSGAGYVHGIGQSQTWKAGESDSRPVLDTVRADCLWRVEVFGTNVTLTVTWGTIKQIQLNDVQCPFAMSMPGQCTIYAKPVKVDGLYVGGEVLCAVTPVSSPGTQFARVLVSGAQPLPREAMRFTSLVAGSTVLLGSSAFGPVTVDKFETVDLIAGSKLTNGTGYLEFEA